MVDENWSEPESQIYEDINRKLQGDERAVIATIVDVEGNAYRRPGAKMLIDPAGRATGSITAGCLEEEVLELSREVQAKGRSHLESYDLMADDDVWGLGLGCNGIIDVLLEPLDESYSTVVDRYTNHGSLSRIVLLGGEDYSQFARAHYTPREGWSIVDDEFPEELQDTLKETVETLLEDGRSKTLELTELESPLRVFVESIVAPDEVVILGSGHDVSPVIELANKNNFHTCSITFRGGVDQSSVASHADQQLKTTPSELLKDYDFGGDTYVVIMTHRFVDDQVALQELAKTDAPYLGLMGPGERFERILEESSSEQRRTLRENLERIYTPIGLNLGGGSPYQIATSIVGEILTISNDRNPSHLKDREGPIHAPVESA